MTTALSPDRRMLIQTILRKASQNAVWSSLPQPLPNSAAQAAGSSICAIECIIQPLVPAR